MLRVWTLLLAAWLAVSPAAAVGGRGEECLPCPEPGDANTTIYDNWVASKDEDWDTIHEEGTCIWNEPGCVCRSIGETCVSDYGIFYDLFLVIVACLFLYQFQFSMRMSIKAVQAMSTADSKKKEKGYSPMEKILFMCALGCFLRFVWVFTIINGRRAEDLVLGIAGDTILVKVAQILWNCAYLYLVLVWSKLLEQVGSMKKNDPAEDKRMEERVRNAVLFLMSFLIPLYIAAALVMPELNMVGNLVQVIMGAYLIVKARAFGKSLAASMGNIESAKPLVATIQATIRLAIFGAVNVFGAVFFNFWAQSRLGPWWNYVFWIFIHVLGEFSLVHACLTTKRMQESKKIAPVKSDNTAVTIASSTEEK